MNPLAKDLNSVLEGTIISQLLSDYGKRMYFPKGIISQSAEAKEKAKLYNATIGIATEHNDALHIPSVLHGFTNNLAVNDIFPYAPTAGDMGLRKVWLQEMMRKNPTMNGKLTSLPVVTSGLTHAISIAFSLFLDKGDEVIVPDFYWGNYNLIFSEQREAVTITTPLFNEDNGLNIEGFSQAIQDAKGNKVSLILNFPNNPTGYTPTKTEAKELVDMLIKKAESGKKLLIFTDDAYFGLFFEENVCRESLFSLLCDAHENILTVKGDAATKEEMVWGFRVGFLTYNSKGLTNDHYEALVKKTMGAIRGDVSSCSKPAQSILFAAMQSPTYLEEKKAGVEKMRVRYNLLKKSLAAYRGNEYLTPLPFNSGYFMSFTCKGDAEKLRLYLLDKYEVGTISIKNSFLRLAFSSTDLGDIEDLLRIVYQAASEVF
ncbi:MAG: aminotransferase class I/II-fold pyridoxal phosphate-dependent enzyme [Spirochaetia bacterium]|nr:aminotransferase class I/II-fold pyridoxal phosphate-dependent enzyme [Spirochaetia bacterium]